MKKLVATSLVVNALALIWLAWLTLSPDGPQSRLDALETRIEATERRFDATGSDLEDAGSIANEALEGVELHRKFLDSFCALNKDFTVSGFDTSLSGIVLGEQRLINVESVCEAVFK